MNSHRSSKTIEPVALDELDTTWGWVNRSGVIPYAVVSGSKGEEIWWLMGLSPQGKLQDFGGGCHGRGGREGERGRKGERGREDENGYQCMMRELDEESTGLLTSMIERRIKEVPELITVWRCRVMKDIPVNRFLMFVPIDYDEGLLDKFRANEEVDAINWYRQKDILDRNRSVSIFHRPLHEFIVYFKSRLERINDQANKV